MGVSSQTALFRCCKRLLPPRGRSAYVLFMQDDYIMRIRATDRPGEFVPLAGSSVPAGFPSPAEDYVDRALDFNQLLIENPAATFAVKIAGESMTGAALLPNDIAAINRARKPTNGCIVLALVEGEFTIKKDIG